MSAAPTITALQKNAMDWVQRMAADPERWQCELDAWLDASADHQEAYERELLRFELSSVALKSSASFGRTIVAERKRPLLRPLPFGIPAVGLAAAAAILLVLSMPGGGLDNPGLPGADVPHEMSLATAHGEIRPFPLPDGSTLTLDTGSRADVVVSSELRQVRLLDGRARVEIAPGEPLFEIALGNRTFVADKGTIDIALEADGGGGITAVAGIGDVRLQQARGINGAPLSLTPAQSMTWEREGTAPREVTELDMAGTRDWPGGWYETRSVRLATLIGEANRYASRPIVIEDADLALSEISGRFRIDRPEVLAGRIAQLLDLEVDVRSDRIVLRRR